MAAELDNSKIESLLVEIRDLHRQHLEEYRRIAGEATAAQKAAIEQSVRGQVRIARLARFVGIVLALVIACLFWFLYRHA